MGGGQPGSEEIVRSETIYAGKLLTLRRDQVRLESGREATREVVLHPGAVAVVPLLPNGRVVMVRQYRHAAGRALLEIPAGTLDQQGESAEDAVARELQEETGYRAAHLAPLVTFYTAPGFCTERISLFLATGLTRGEQTMMDDEAIMIEEIALADLPALIARGEIADAKTLTGLLLAQNHRSPVGA
ncbi:MAG: ADP-ribose pyrophosphatase [uncultured Thermomicrobiales bacterium]|uniref:GDP-mannose pyrophosphatase n=1 Tax=uncultured Thermomicrobiales bacterium TaxID=1645740 RepID=A0A6J4UL57_9BACT|nr:MAG: ADP-ribose pyrophosphatase [uncultured Thermomicrobiales bacterium]